jgi:hypothetical protein
MRLKLVVVVTVGLVTASAASLALAAASGWRVIGHASASGDFAVAAASGSANHPGTLAVRVTGGGAVSGLGIVACSKGFGSIGSTSTDFKGHYKVLKLPMKKADSCQVTASASGSGRLKLEILAR